MSEKLRLLINYIEELKDKWEEYKRNSWNEDLDYNVRVKIYVLLTKKIAPLLDSIKYDNNINIATNWDYNIDKIINLSEINFNQYQFEERILFPLMNLESELQIKKVDNLDLSRFFNQKLNEINLIYSQVGYLEKKVNPSNNNLINYIRNKYINYYQDFENLADNVSQKEIQQIEKAIDKDLDGMKLIFIEKAKKGLSKNKFSGQDNKSIALMVSKYKEELAKKGFQLDRNKNIEDIYNQVNCFCKEYDEYKCNNNEFEISDKLIDLFTEVIKPLIDSCEEVLLAIYDLEIENIMLSDIEKQLMQIKGFYLKTSVYGTGFACKKEDLDYFYDVLINLNQNLLKIKQIGMEENSIEREYNKEDVQERSVRKENKEIIQTNEKQENEKLEQDSELISNEDLKFNNMLVGFVAIHKAYYDGKKGKRGTAHTKEEIAQKNKANQAMKKYLKNKIERFSSEEDGNDNYLIEKLNNPVEESLVDEVVNSKGACLKLMNIMASGVYERNDERIKLTQKQRVALASIMTQVSDKLLSKESIKNEKNTKSVSLENDLVFEME